MQSETGTPAGENDRASPKKPADELPAQAVEALVGGGFDPSSESTPIVGLGGSAGSLEALQQFFSKVPADTGMAYVVVVHLYPNHESALAAILQRVTSIPVIQVSQQVKIQPNHVYVIPPSKHLALADGSLQLLEMTRQKGRHITVDLFFRNLADACGSGATAIILSGGDGDGACGLKRVKERGGLTIAQDPCEAIADGMPRAAIATGMVDWVLPVGDMPLRIMQYRKGGRRIRLPAEEATRVAFSNEEREEACLRGIFFFLKARTGHDFSSYKRATVLRRIGRRMLVNGTEDLEGYLAFVRTHQGETGALLQDLLISVTNFFRDPEAFCALGAGLPDLFHGKGPEDHIRVWIPACATGEEAYSVAILLCEYTSTLEQAPQIQILATDLDKQAIESAREGRYPTTIAADVSEERLRNFFVEEQGGYRIRRIIRETVLFAAHDLLIDSPFSRLDLVCCRNFLIYLNREAQSRVFDIFHFALRPGGRLFLGSSESAEEAAALFSPIDKKHRIYGRRAVQRVGLNVPTGASTIAFALEPPMVGTPALNVPAGTTYLTGLASPGRSEPVQRNTWADLHLKLLECLSPPSLLVSKDHHDIVHLSKSVGKYLQFPSGEATMNLLRVVHPSLRAELRAALFRAAKAELPIEIRDITMEIDGVSCLVDVTLQAVDKVTDEFLLILFHEHDSTHAPVAETPCQASVGQEPKADVVHHLEEELDQMKLRLRDTVEQYEASTEELKASNEELQAMNEELRSATEELETGREELQSINEEIIAINQELKDKVEELSRANSDLQNLMASTNIATIFLDRELRIKRFTPSSTGLFNFIPSDINRPLSDLTTTLDYSDISQDAAGVLTRLSPVEREVRDITGRWFLARMLPYRTAEDQIAGVVITCVDITARKAAEENERWLSNVVESSNDAILSFTLDATIVSWNKGAERIFGYTADEIIGRSQNILLPSDRQEEKQEILAKLKRGESIEQFETTCLRSDGQLIDVCLTASVMADETGTIIGATAIAQDITLRKAAVEGLRLAKEELEERVAQRTAELRRRAGQLAFMASELTLTEQRERKRMAHVLHDQLQQLLVAAKMRISWTETLDPEARKPEVAKLIALVDEALDNSRSLAVELSPPILVDGLGRALQWLCCDWMGEKHHLLVHCHIDVSLDTPHEDMRILLFLAVKELLFNIVKHAKVMEAFVEVVAHDSQNLRVSVKDQGVGIPPHYEVKTNGSGSGFGLLSLRERLELLGGSFEIRSLPGKGTEAVILAPRRQTILEPEIQYPKPQNLT
jgi:two-component system CheB/CheR fusion protein